jgi:TonB family protein
MHSLYYFMRLATIHLAFALVLLTEAAIAAEKAPVKINYVTGSLLVDKKSGRSGDLNSISFSIENAATRPLEWVRLRVTTRSPAGALLQTETFEEELGKNPIGSKEARRITRYMSIDGFLIGGKQGSIDIDVVDYRLSPEDGWLLLIPPSRDMGLETAYFDSIKRSIELGWQYPELALRYGLQGKLLLQFSILGNGKLESAKIIRSSGFNLLDNEALRAVSAAVLPPIPERLLISAWMEYRLDGRRLDMQFAKDVDSYDIKKPLSEWRRVRSFNNLTACEEYKKREAAGNLPSLKEVLKADASTRSSIDALGYDPSRCVPSDSLTIK